MEELGLNWDEDTQDKGDHLNVYGAEKVTSYLGNYLEENYELEDHRNDPAYEEFRKVLPADYRLFQVADLFCTLELVCLKDEHHIMSKSEETFFGSMRDMRKNYLKPMYRKRYIH